MKYYLALFFCFLAAVATNPYVMVGFELAAFMLLNKEVREFIKNGL